MFISFADSWELEVGSWEWGEGTGTINTQLPTSNWERGRAFGSGHSEIVFEFVISRVGGYYLTCQGGSELSEQMKTPKQVR